MKRKLMSVSQRYGSDKKSAADAQRLAHWISQGPVVFQAARVMLKSGLLQNIADSGEGLTLEQAAVSAGLSRYAAQVLLESALTMEIVYLDGDRFRCSKAGWFLLNDRMVRVNMDFNHDVNYVGMFDLDKALYESRPAGLEHFGKWGTVYEALSQLPDNVRKSWFAFDHYYSDGSFDEALEIVFSSKGGRLLDVGGNTGRFALRVVGYDGDVKVTVMDLPGQLEMMSEAVRGHEGADRIDGFAADLLDESTAFPKGYDKIWMSQFLDCFSEEQVISILKRAAESMDAGSRLYIMESYWDRQAFDTAAFALAQTSLYFTAIANGNSKMYKYSDMLRCIEEAGLEVEDCTDGLGVCHTLLVCRKAR